MIRWKLLNGGAEEWAEDLEDGVFPIEPENWAPIYSRGGR